MSISAFIPAHQNLTVMLYLYYLYNVDRISIYVINLAKLQALCVLEQKRDVFKPE